MRRKKIIITLTLFFCVTLLYNISHVNADSGWDYDYDYGGSWGSNYDYDYDYDYDYSYDYGNSWNSRYDYGTGNSNYQNDNGIKKNNFISWLYTSTNNIGNNIYICYERRNT